MDSNLNQSLAIVIPAYNEEATIVKVVKEFSKIGIPIVVDDCSTDKTAQYAVESGAILVRQKVNLGYEAAIQSGFDKATLLNVDFIITADADGQHTSEAITIVKDALISGVDLVVGIRHKKQRLVEHLAGYLSTFLWGVSDPFSGLKGYSKSSYQMVGFFDSRKLTGCELMVRLFNLGVRAKNVNIVCLSRADESRFGNAFLGNLKLAKSMIKLILLHLNVKN